MQSLAGNVAVLRCGVPGAARALVRVVGWQRDGASIHLGTSGRYTATSTGTLHVRDVRAEDATATFYCHTQHALSEEARLSSGAQIVVKGTAELFDLCKL